MKSFNDPPKYDPSMDPLEWLILLEEYSEQYVEQYLDNMINRIYDEL